jgi:hypothetical protein
MKQINFDDGTIIPGDKVKDDLWPDKLTPEISLKCKTCGDKLDEVDLLREYGICNQCLVNKKLSHQDGNANGNMENK